MAVPTRPASGAVIESAWGGAAHDAAVGVIGVQGTAPAVTVSGTANWLSPAATRGRASMISGFAVVAPVDGLYEAVVMFAASPAANQVWRAFIETDQSGAFVNVGFGIASSPVAGWSQAQVLTALVFLSAGKSLRFKADSSAALNVSSAQWSVAYRGADYA